MIVFAVIVTLLVILVRYWYNYWTREGFPSAKKSIPFGVLGSVVAQKQSFGEAIRDAYLRHTGPYLGIFFLFRPVLLLRDPELIKKVLINDFDYFSDRGFPYDEENDPVGANMTAMPCDKWRIVRAKLSPTFSSGKLKAMFRTMDEKTRLLEQHLDAVGDEVRLKVPVEHLMVSALAAIFCGVEVNAFQQPDHELVEMARLFFSPENVKDKIRVASIFLLPNVMMWLRLSFLPTETAQYALSVVRKVIGMRKTDPSTIRNDFIQTIMELMNEDQKDGSEPMSLI